LVVTPQPIPKQCDYLTRLFIMMLLDSMCDSLAHSWQQLATKAGSDGRQMDVRSMALLALALLSITAPLELSQLSFAIIGAFAYALLQYMQVPTSGAAQQQRSKEKAYALDAPPSPPTTAASPKFTPTPTSYRSWRERSAATPSPRKPAHLASAGSDARRNEGPKQEFRQPSSQPIPKPCFWAVGWDAEVQELLAQIYPSPESDKVVAQLARAVKRQLSRYIPEIEVTGFLSSDLHRGTAFGVAVPEVDIVASVSPDVFLSCVQHARQPPSAVLADAKKVQKCAIRFCTNQLVGTGGFKFRRSAFKGLEPKVTLLASAGLCGTKEAIPVDFSVNSSTPLYNAALMTECGQLEPRARALILLVRRWAKDRGVCHAAKGHLSPYAWTLLVIYFLQVGVRSGPLLPPLDGFKRSAGLAGKPAASAASGWTRPEGGIGGQKTVGALFKEFVAFFAKDFDFRKEAVSVRRGLRAPPDLALPIHVVLCEDGVTSEVAPSIEDPFEPKRNLSETSTAVTVARLHEELTRAEELCSRGGSLAELLEPWVPPERAEGDEEVDI